MINITPMWETNPITPVELDHRIPGPTEIDHDAGQTGPTLSEIIEQSQKEADQLKRRLAIIDAQRGDALRSWTHDTGLMFWFGMLMGSIVGLIVGIYLF